MRGGGGGHRCSSSFLGRWGQFLHPQGSPALPEIFLLFLLCVCHLQGPSCCCWKRFSPWDLCVFPYGPLVRLIGLRSLSSTSTAERCQNPFFFFLSLISYHARKNHDRAPHFYFQTIKKRKCWGGRYNWKKFWGEPRRRWCSTSRWQFNCVTAWKLCCFFFPSDSSTLLKHWKEGGEI